MRRGPAALTLRARLTFHSPPQANLYPTVGLQTPGEIVDAQLGQQPFLFDIEDYMGVAAKVQGTVHCFHQCPALANGRRRCRSESLGPARSRPQASLVTPELLQAALRTLVSSVPSGKHSQG